jgi:hypothetical protein
MRPASRVVEQSSMDFVAPSGRKPWSRPHPNAASSKMFPLFWHFNFSADRRFRAAWSRRAHGSCCGRIEIAKEQKVRELCGLSIFPSLLMRQTSRLCHYRFMLVLLVRLEAGGHVFAIFVKIRSLDRLRHLRWLSLPRPRGTLPRAPIGTGPTALGRSLRGRVGKAAAAPNFHYSGAFQSSAGNVRCHIGSGKDGARRADGSVPERRFCDLEHYCVETKD